MPFLRLTFNLVGYAFLSCWFLSLISTMPIWERKIEHTNLKFPSYMEETVSNLPNREMSLLSVWVFFYSSVNMQVWYPIVSRSAIHESPFWHLGIRVCSPSWNGHIWCWDGDNLRPFYGTYLLLLPCIDTLCLGFFNFVSLF